ncbi:hypothetical protein BKA70DRAFT_1229945 [Coprinopsis sp. MPI-PUGE-AT-0042]|nr:hypothetical protein BKA70DRAFT_1229945 [Coprinopsis sp. MPI-PUGE-AT-0042]
MEVDTAQIQTSGARPLAHSSFMPRMTAAERSYCQRSVQEEHAQARAQARAQVQARAQAQVQLQAQNALIRSQQRRIDELEEKARHTRYMRALTSRQTGRNPVLGWDIHADRDVTLSKTINKVCQFEVEDKPRKPATGDQGWSASRWWSHKKPKASDNYKTSLPPERAPSSKQPTWCQPPSLNHKKRAELDSLPKNTLVDAVLQLQLEVERLRQRIKFVDTLWYQSRRNLELLFNKLSSSAADPGVLSVESMSDGRIPN